jgi:hypothetical protein
MIKKEFRKWGEGGGRRKKTQKQILMSFKRELKNIKQSFFGGWLLCLVDGFRDKNLFIFTSDVGMKVTQKDTRLIKGVTTAISFERVKST